MMTVQLALQRKKNHQKNEIKIVIEKRKRNVKEKEKKKKIETVITAGKNQKSNFLNKSKSKFY